MSLNILFQVGADAPTVIVLYRKFHIMYQVKNFSAASKDLSNAYPSYIFSSRRGKVYPARQPPDKQHERGLSEFDATPPFSGGCRPLYCESRPHARPLYPTPPDLLSRIIFMHYLRITSIHLATF
jgi:hypothetical protein